MRLVWLLLYGIAKIIEHLADRLADYAKEKAFPDDDDKKSKNT
jgi:hypothetical protein